MSPITAISTQIHATYPHQPTFLQAVDEVLATLAPALEANSASNADYARVARLLSPERVISFKVIWSDDAGTLQHNIGYRIQFNSALGPYKGGLRFDASVTEDILKFLGFEQIFKNALTGLPLGGGKGGSDFNPKGKSENEIRSFCRAFMTELYRHIGIDVDVPAGDMGVGGREIGYMMGMYKQIVNRSEGVMTGKDPLIGGSLGRTEATGHGVVYFAEAMLREAGKNLVGMTAVVSGSGNVAEHTVRMLIAKGAVVLTMSDRGGYIHKPEGLTESDVNAIMSHKNTGSDLATLTHEGIEYRTGAPWQTVVAEAYFPCATQNEISEADAKVIANHATLVVEGANMPLCNEAVSVLNAAHIPHAPGKASNAGGVAVSGLEMAQNAGHYPWTRERVESELMEIMERIHTTCKEHGTESWGIDYFKGANIGGAKRVLAAMEKLGW
ncbi:NADP-specific glutamate dehydrogenase [Patescibacteria group bacterium]|nr:NADP-specific glutamate dehydrogenase [Patescibacteria group bacterium]